MILPIWNNNNYLPAQVFVMNRWQASVWPLYSGASVTINGGVILFKCWTVFSDKLSSVNLFLVTKLSFFFPLTVSCFK